MRIRLLSAVSAVAVAAAFPIGTTAHAETLLVDRVKQERSLDTPHRGMSMAQVESRFGPPRDKMAPAGGDAPRHPVINRWVYDSYIVYFERDRVISSVAARATPNEIGPKGSPGNE